MLVSELYHVTHVWHQSGTTWLLKGGHHSASPVTVSALPSHQNLHNALSILLNWGTGKGYRETTILNSTSSKVYHITYRTSMIRTWYTSAVLCCGSFSSKKKCIASTSFPRTHTYTHRHVAFHEHIDRYVGTIAYFPEHVWPLYMSEEPARITHCTCALGH